MAEIIKCPNCTKPLQVPDSYAGQTVQCPECRHQFAAPSNAVSSQPAPPISVTPMTSPPLPKYEEDRRDEDSRERSSRYDRDDYDDIDRSRRSGRLSPHRGGAVLIFGIIGLTICIICGPIAWSMANADLAEIRAGRMDPSGEGMTQAGRILGMIATGLLVLQVLAFCLIFGFVGLAGPR